MANLRNFRFTSRSDFALSFNGWVNRNQLVNTQAGNDLILGVGASTGLNQQAGVIDTNDGNDSIQGTGRSYGISNSSNSTIHTGHGNDTIFGSATSSSSVCGILNYESRIFTGEGDDTIIGSSRNGGTGLLNKADPGDNSLIDTGDGNDSLRGDGYAQGVMNQGGFPWGCSILTGAGNDSITGSAVIGDGIHNSSFGLIDTGAGDDTITGRGGAAGFDIFNAGSISTGEGNDVIDALSKGFGGTGFCDLGPGDDQLKGFGAGLFEAGDGTEDTLSLQAGTYTIQDLGSSIYGISLVGDLSGALMQVRGFEKFGSGANITDFMAAAGTGQVVFS
ncbi:MAG: hypothetical protein VKJ44_00120 [Synechococcus sp.]|nr:hypothetical protein [Synechococcus sp.]